MALLARYTLRMRTLVDRAMNNAHFDLLSKPFRSPWAKEAVLDASGVLSQMGGCIFSASISYLPTYNRGEII